MRIFPNKRTLLSSVFTQQTATSAYVSRPKLENSFSCEFSKLGRPLVIYGLSGNGKTTLVTKMIEGADFSPLKLTCSEGMTCSDIFNYFATELNVSYTATVSRSSNQKLAGSAGYHASKQVEGGIECSMSNGVETTSRLIGTPILTAQKVFERISKKNAVMIVDDFQKVAITERQKFEDLLKSFVGIQDNKGRVICIGAAAARNDLFNTPSDMVNRIGEIEVPALTKDELCQLVKKGFKVLNLSSSDDFIENIVNYADQQATVVHELCYNICFLSGYTRKCFFKKELENVAFRKAVDHYINGKRQIFCHLVDLISASGQESRVLNAMTKINHGGVTVEDLKPFLRGISDEVIEDTLSSLSSEKYMILAYDRTKKAYSFSHAFMSRTVYYACRWKDRTDAVYKNEKKNVCEIPALVDYALMSFIKQYKSGNPD